MIPFLNIKKNRFRVILVGAFCLLASWKLLGWRERGGGGAGRTAVLSLLEKQKIKEARPWAHFHEVSTAPLHEFFSALSPHSLHFPNAPGAMQAASFCILQILAERGHSISANVG